MPFKEVVERALALRPQVRQLSDNLTLIWKNADKEATHIGDHPEYREAVDDLHKVHQATENDAMKFYRDNVTKAFDKPQFMKS